MLPDSALIDLAARVDRQSKRVERLETLEFGTTAFPSGGTFSPICDIILPAPAPSVTFCPFPIPGTFRHLWAVINCWSTLLPPDFAITKIEVNLNADFGSVYTNYQRQEHVFGPVPPLTDTEVGSTSVSVTRTSWLISLPSQRLIVGGERATVDFILFPGYTSTEYRKAFGFWGYTNPITAEPFAFQSADQGGGLYLRAPIVPITSITLTHPFPGAFFTGSRFTLYGM